MKRVKFAGWTVAVFLTAGAAAVAAAGDVAMRVDRPGAVKPAGWLLDNARTNRDGFTGHLDEVDMHFRRAWSKDWTAHGKCLNWARWENGKEVSRDDCSWSTEAGSYWFEGLVKLAWQLDDEGLKALAKRKLETYLERVNDTTVGFMWWFDRRDPKQLEEAVVDGLWQSWVQGNSVRVLTAYYDATGDERALRALKGAFNCRTVAQTNGEWSVTLLGGAYEVWRRTHDPEVKLFLDDCCRAITNNPNCRHYQTPPWEKLHETLNLKRKHTWRYKLPDRHGVNGSESLLSIWRMALYTGKRQYADSVLAWYGFFDRYCSQPYGVTTMDEEWGWRGAKRGTETCDVAAESFTKRNILETLGDGTWGDQLERAFFNAGQAAVSRDFRRHVYFQMPNRTGATNEAAQMSCPWDTHVRYGLSVWPLCCTAASTRILPAYVEAMWMKGTDGSVVAALYGPSTYETEIPAGKVAFEEVTDYPFAETVKIAVKSAPEKAFALKVRIPGWCEGHDVAVNGRSVNAAVVKGFVTVSRVWTAGDEVTVRLPMAPRFEDFTDENEHGRPRRSVVMGPLLFAYPIPEKDDNTPAGEVVEPVLAQAQEPSAARVARTAVPRPWNWEVSKAPVTLTLEDADGVSRTLVPYGCTKLRISAFGKK